uniref:Uncharacterized protein n=1 Tax=Aegilops tauschii subsp. strangulata TaxID=200361 RepID=A0A453P3K2_AEGTS
ASRIHPPSIPNETDELTPRVRSEAVRAGGAARDRDGHGAAGVRAGGAGAAQQQRRVRGGAEPRRGPLQPAGGGHGARPQPRRRRRRLRLRQRLPRKLRLPRQPAELRVHEREGGVLWAGAVQRDRAVHGGVQRVRRPGGVRLLGRLPPHGAGQPHHRRSVHARVHRLHAPHEPQHHTRHGPAAGGSSLASYQCYVLLILLID